MVNDLQFRGIYSNIEQKKEVRSLVMAGLEQIKEGKTQDFNTACDRLEKKYTK